MTSTRYIVCTDVDTFGTFLPGEYDSIDAADVAARTAGLTADGYMLGTAEDFAR